MEKILIAGGSGLIGQALAKYLTEQKYAVSILSRSKSNASTGNVFHWDIKEKTIEPEALEGLYGVINLAGAGIVDKAWTPARKKVLRDSRIEGNLLLAEKLRQQKEDLPQVFIGGSAIGYYGQRPNEILDEKSDPGAPSFLVDLCQEWEESAMAVSKLGIRTCLLRTGLVLSSAGGVLPTLLKTMPLGIGTSFGNGAMGTSWIHITDLCRQIQWMLETKGVVGPVNGVAPNPLGYRDFIKALASYKGGLKIVLPAPTFMMRMLMGDRTQAILQDATIMPRKSQDGGFEFSFPKIQAALSDLT